MSSMIPMPPPRIALGGGGPAGPGGPPMGPSGPPQGAQPDVDPQAVKTSLQAAIKNLQDAQTAEGDDADAAAISQIIAKIHTMVGAHQGLVDQAMGAGPGVKLIRKTTPRGGAGGGGAGGGY